MAVVEPEPMQLSRQPTPLSAVDIEHEDFEWLRAYLQREAAPEPVDLEVPLVGRKHKSHHSSSCSSSDMSTCDSPSHDEQRSFDGSWDGEEPGAAQPTGKRRKIGWTQTEDLVILTSVRKLGTQWPRIASQLPGRTSDAVRRGAAAPRTPQCGPPATKT